MTDARSSLSKNREYDTLPYSGERNSDPLIRYCQDRINTATEGMTSLDRTRFYVLFAARLVESAAFDRAGSVSSVNVADLIGLAAQLEHIVEDVS